MAALLLFALSKLVYPEVEESKFKNNKEVKLPPWVSPMKHIIWEMVTHAESRVVLWFRLHASRRGNNMIPYLLVSTLCL